MSRLTAKGAQTRERIVAAAAALMFDQGVAATRLEDVQAAAGVGASQLYHYFTDKLDLVRAVIVHQGDTVVGAQISTLADVSSIADLRAWADVVVAEQDRLHCRGGCPIGSLSSELAEADPDARYQLAATFTRWSDAIRDGLRRMSAEGVLTPAARPDDLAVAVLAAVQGGLLLGQAQRSTRPLRLALDAAVDHVASYAVTDASPVP